MNTSRINWPLTAALGLCLVAGSASAAVVHEQALPTWSNGYCSPCGTGALSFRMFASFSLLEATTLTAGDFAILDTSPFGAQDFSVSVWDAPLGNELFSMAFPEGSYTRTGSASTHVATVELPGWTLSAGSYWISLYGINGNYLSWGTDRRVGDDAYYRGTGTLASGERYVGFRLHGDAVPTPLPGTLGLLGLGLAGLLAAGRRSRVS